MKKRILFTAAALVCAANLTAQCLGVGSSTSSMSPEEMAAAAKAGVEYVEIGISGRGTVAEIREKALHAKRMADEAGLKVWSCHLPFSRKLDISVLNDSARMANLEFLTEMIAICGEVGPEKLVLHPSSEPIADGEREQRIRNSIASIGILRREAARIGAQLCIEDLPRTCLGRNSAELLRIIAAVACCSYDDLRQRERVRKRKRIASIAASIVAILGIICALILQASTANQEALIAESKTLAAAS